MKIPTLFGRTPKHQKFSFEPRFYDAKKEEREERERRIRQQLENEKTGDIAGFETRIKGSFHSARKRSSASQADLRASLMRIAILLFLVALIVAYLQWGSVALYGMFVIVPVYLWMKFKR
jgi:Flp pilus assembly protein TadB